jgi:hypothetical protein
MVRVEPVVLFFMQPLEPTAVTMSVVIVMRTSSRRRCAQKDRQRASCNYGKSRPLLHLVHLSLSFARGRRKTVPAHLTEYKDVAGFPV